MGCVASRLTAAVGYLGHDLIIKRRLTFLRHGGVWDCVELDHERAVLLGFECAMGDLSLLRMDRPAAPVMPAPPNRPTRLPRDVKLALGRANRRAGVVGRLAVEMNRIAQLGRLLRLAQFDEKFRSLVFLHAKVSLSTRRVGGLNEVAAGEPIFRRGEAAGERAVAVGLQV